MDEKPEDIFREKKYVRENHLFDIDRHGDPEGKEFPLEISDRIITRVAEAVKRYAQSRGRATQVEYQHGYTGHVPFQIRRITEVKIKSNDGIIYTEVSYHEPFRCGNGMAYGASIKAQLWFNSIDPRNAEEYHGLDNIVKAALGSDSTELSGETVYVIGNRSIDLPLRQMEEGKEKR